MPSPSTVDSATKSSESTVVHSGTKYQHRHGHAAIKDGVKLTSKLLPVIDKTRVRKPAWIRVRLPAGKRFYRVQEIVKENRLATVCEESHCPNIGECWSHGTATLMLMGDVCTRACRFCAVDTGNPGGWLDENEPFAAANAVRLMNLRYVVLTSVDRDDLPLGGASHYADCVRAIRQMNKNTMVEALTPDFQGDKESITVVVGSKLDVFAHNIETVKRMSPSVRDPRANYEQSLRVLATAKQAGAKLTKSGLMLGLGESEEELRQTMIDLRERDVDLLTLGQYLRPTKNHLPVKRWVTPEEFNTYREWALHYGFQEVSSGPLVRSSYRADQLVKQARSVNVGVSNAEF